MFYEAFTISYRSDRTFRLCEGSHERQIHSLQTKYISVGHDLQKMQKEVSAFRLLRPQTYHERKLNDFLATGSYMTRPVVQFKTTNILRQLLHP